VPRGLSGLQKRILLMACERRQGRDLDAEREEGEALLAKYGAADLYEPAPDIYHPELLAEIWGFPRAYLFPAQRFAKWGERPIGSGWHGQYFDRDAIGRSEYDKATTTLWRSVERLERRGLAVRAFYGKPGVFLSGEGLEVAERLSVERVSPLQSFNR
jgi:hypothetical protein